MARTPAAGSLEVALKNNFLHTAKDGWVARYIRHRDSECTLGTPIRWTTPVRELRPLAFQSRAHTTMR